MLFFRSEEHAKRWSERAKPPAATILPIEQATALAHAWFKNKLDPDWRRFNNDEAEAIFDDLALDPEFWRLS
ncbi:MAG: hypothetical protein E6I19_08460 [Chloroflexi bacterium]|nr:MAG: hypothetical protein E6I48_11485 [Chloroflexota bacterium]TMF55354.1 MAG: hypothetical protein E6I19_08460 [Chloroflexota bacterium]